MTLTEPGCGAAQLPYITRWEAMPTCFTASSHAVFEGAKMVRGAAGSDRALSKPAAGPRRDLREPGGPALHVERCACPGMSSKGSWATA